MYHSISLSIKPKVHLILLVLTACSTISYLHLPISCFETAKFLYQFSSVAKSWPTLCDPMNRSSPGLPVHHQLLEFTQTHVHLVGDAIHPSHPPSSPSPPAPNPSQHQGLFQWVNSLREAAKVLEFSFSISPSSEHPGLIFGWTGWISLKSKGLSRVFSNTTVQKYQFFTTPHPPPALFNSL